MVSTRSSAITGLVDGAISTLSFKLIIMPLNYKSRKSMRRMSNLQPQMTKLQKKYENDKESSTRRCPSFTARKASTP